MQHCSLVDMLTCTCKAQSDILTCVQKNILALNCGKCCLCLLKVSPAVLHAEKTSFVIAGCETVGTPFFLLAVVLQSEFSHFQILYL